MLVTIPLELLNHPPCGLLAYLLLPQHIIILHPLCIHRLSQTLTPQTHTLFRLRLLQPPLPPPIQLQRQNSRIYQLLMQRYPQKLLNLQHPPPLLPPPRLLLPPIQSLLVLIPHRVMWWIE